MDASSLTKVCVESLANDKYVKIYHKGRERNIYPLGYKDGPGGTRLFAWCELHPNEEAESFLLYNIAWAEVSYDSIYYTPTLPSVFSPEYYDG